MEGRALVAVDQTTIVIPCRPVRCRCPYEQTRAAAVRASTPAIAAIAGPSGGRDRRRQGGCRGVKEPLDSRKGAAAGGEMQRQQPSGGWSAAATVVVTVSRRGRRE